MKTKTNMKTLKFFTLLSLLPATCYLLLVLLSCEQPFKAGLGPVIDLQKPTIVLEYPVAGAYIRGEVTFNGYAKDDYKLDTVWFNISNYPDVDLTLIPHKNTYIKEVIDDNIFYKITNVSGDIRYITWDFKIDTKLMVDVFDEAGFPVYELDGSQKQERVFPDGDFKIRLRATDSMGKSTTTDEIIFYIKNDIPEITITQPAISQGTDPGDLGGPHLNYDYLNPDPEKRLTFRRTPFIESPMVGLISDFEGIYLGRQMIVVIAEDGDPIKEEDGTPILDKDGSIKVDKNGNPKTPKLDKDGKEVTVELFPPQIRFWQVDVRGSVTDTSVDVKPAGWIPSDNPSDPDYMPWVKIGKDGIGEFIGGDGIKTLMFTYTLPDKSGQYYAFQVRAHSIDKVHSRAEYPRDYVNYDFFDSDGKLKKDDPVVMENAYVLLRLVEPLEFPTLGLYKLEDIYGAPAKGDDNVLKPFRAPPASGTAAMGAMQYNRLPKDEITDEDITDQVELVGNHSYIDKNTISKGGPFKLRVWAKHPQDIASVKVYWQRDGSPDKGRFIWDWNDRPSGWPGSVGVISPISSPYYEWGLNEWDGVDENGANKNTVNTALRSYVFTYKDDGNDKVPDAAYEDIRGKSKVQKYKGSDSITDDKGVTRQRNLDELPDEMTNWDDVDRLAEGNYTLSIYATSMGGTPCMMPLLVYLSIDRTKPEIELDDVRGKVGDDIEEPVKVNGVIEPKFVISDSLSTIRPGTPIKYFEKTPAGFYNEQIFIVVKEEDKSAIDNYFKIGEFLDTTKNVWPELPGTPGGKGWRINNVDILKHGLIIDSVCRFRTSKIYHIPDSPTYHPPENADGEVLKDGQYRVYAFTRDSAFNVNSLSFLINVVEKSDYPEFDWELNSINIDVTEPDSSYDFGGVNYGDLSTQKKDASFRVPGGENKPDEIRNKLEPGASITVKISDDDGLDLGVKDGAASGVKVTFIGSKPDDGSGEIKALQESTHLITLSDADVKKAFPPMNVNAKGPIVVKEATGTISQTVLLDALKNKGEYNYLFGIVDGGDTDEQKEAKKDAFSSLPDGIYRVGITVSDYQGAKLEMPGDRPADTVSVDIRNNVIHKKNDEITKDDIDYFWIAVDSKDPQVDITYYEDGDDPNVEVKTQKAGYISARGKLPLVGTVSDENGPIVLVDWRARNIMTGEELSMSTQNDPEKAGAARIITSSTSDSSIGLTKLDYSGGKWNYKFSYLMDMNERTEGAYNFEVTFRDRFGRTTTRTLTYSVDKKPPTISIIPIETFSRPTLPNSDITAYTHLSDNIQLNKERLAVKVVNFTVTVSDENAIGLRWWLLPADTGANSTGVRGAFDTTGKVSDYDSFPAKVFTSGNSETYYGSPAQPDSFTKGAYGYLKVNKSGTFTIAVDTEKLLSPSNGEYRLHIIAIDDANNVSNYASPPIIADSHVFQEVFFLQEEDKPYFGDLDNITPGVVVEKTTANPLGAKWPSVDMDVRSDANPTVLGTIFENNGFLLKPDGKTLAWPGSITIWFSETDTDAKRDLPDTMVDPVTGSPSASSNAIPEWEYKVSIGGNLTGYTKIIYPDNFDEGINPMGGTKNYNVSLRIRLADRFPGLFNDDGYKRYIIMAKDSPVNKLKYDKTTPTPPALAPPVPDGIPMGVGNTPTEDEGVRVARWRQFAFIYDANPPEVIITKPNETDGNKFGPEFNDSVKGFNLKGYISDMNLATVAYYYENLPKDHKNYLAAVAAGNITNNKYIGGDKDYYYFEYYLDSNSEARNIFVLNETNSDIGVKKTVTNGVTKVEFDIKPGVVTAANGIIPANDFFADSFEEGQHTLNVFATDKSGREGGAWVGFTKDTKPPAIAFSNLNADSRAYDKKNPSRADRNAANPANDDATPDKTWWTTMSREEKQRRLLGDSSNTSPLKLTTISYDKSTGGIPELRGTITDLVSNIKLIVAPDPDVGSGDVNQAASSFKYWIDDNGASDSTARHLALIDGNNTRSIRWTILLTDTGRKDGTPLPDGVHTIVLTAADETNAEIESKDRYMIAFRIDSQAPKSAAGVDGGQSVYGHVDYQNAIMFTVDLGAQDANLDRMELNIVKQGETKPAIERIFRPLGVFRPNRDGNNVPLNPPELPATETITATWTYVPNGATALPTAPALPTIPTFNPPLPGHPTPTLKEDYVVFVGKFPVPKTMFQGVPSGKYDAKVIAYDTAGNKSEEYTWTFTYDIDKPKIVFTSPDKTEVKPNPAATNSLLPENLIYLEDPTLEPNPEFIPDPDNPGQTKRNPLYSASKGNVNRMTSENLRIQGMVIDDFSAVRVVESRVEKWNWVTSVINGTTHTMNTWTEVEPWKPVRTLTGNQALQISWTKNLLGQNAGDLDLRTLASAGTGVPLGTNLPPAEGLYRIQVRAKDSSVIAIQPPTGQEWGSAGQGNPSVSEYVYFYFDRNNPELKITKINGEDTAKAATYYTAPPDGGFSFEGTIRDSNRVAKIEVLFKRTGDNDTPPIPMTVTRSRYVPDPIPTPPSADPDYNANDPSPTGTINIGGIKQTWTAKFDNNAPTLKDGRYTVTITAYDMTGRSTREERAFVLDMTKPTLKFTAPTKVMNRGYGDDSENPKPNTAGANGFANADTMVILAGPTSVITGVTEDKAPSPDLIGTESGIDQMWFHLGFIDKVTTTPNYPTGITDDTNFPFPTKAAIKAWEDELIRRHSGKPATEVAAMSIKDRNDWMNTIADYRASGAGANTDPLGNAWFKLGGKSKPTGFVINNPNIYDWRFEIPQTITDIPAYDKYDYDNTFVNGAAITAGTQIEGLKLYCGPITVKGRQYYINPTAAPIRQMVRAVSGSVYRLPLWVRITDIAGNVEYYCHDIWIDANGSIPSTSIESPSNGTRYNARGGAISVDGVARSNTSVYDVIFRVFADGEPDTNLDGIQTNNQPNPAYKTISGQNNNTLGRRPYGAYPYNANSFDNFVRIPGYDPADSASVLLLPTEYRPRPGDSWNWQKANLTMPGGSGEPLIPWNIMLNSDEHLAKLIGDRGFVSGAGGTNKDTMRVWLEVFVFNGTGTPILASIYPNDNLGTASQDYNTNGGRLYGTPEPKAGAPNTATPGPMPYVKSFYLKTGAVEITHPNVGTMSDGTPANPAGPFTSPFRRNNVWWNAESSQNQGGGGYGGSGTETRSNKFAISATLDPAKGSESSLLGEVSYRIKIDGGVYGNWTTAWTRTQTNTDPTTANLPTGISISRRGDTPSDTGSPTRTRYYFDYKIDSKPANNALSPGYTSVPVPLTPPNINVWANTGGTMTVQIRIRDNSSPPNEAEQTIQVGVDNFPPIGDDKSYGNSTVAGTNVTFQGRAYDFATSPAGQVMLKDSDFAPKKLKRVYAWFTKTIGGTEYYINMNTGDRGKPVGTTTTGTPATLAMTAFKDRNATITDGGASEDTPTAIDITGSKVGTPDQYYVPQRATGETAWNAGFVREIDQATGQPANKMLWSPVKSLNYDVKWQFTLDSTKLPDGKITLHYIVEDEAGNASYYKQPDITVKNRYPEITRVTLYTDNNGQGAAFTKDDTIEYDLNDYRAKMFYNYTDTADKGKSDTTGYLNSGFIAKNNYIGFRVETERGNRPLTFRLQHVTRKRVTLTAANLQTMLQARNNANNINLYTIAWHGDYSVANWKAIGVPIDKNPTLGTHFVLQWPEGSNNPGPTGTLPTGYKSSDTAEVWQYTLRVGKPDVRPTGTAQAEDPAVNPVVLGPNTTYPGGANLNFSGATEFNGTGANPTNSILEKNGSRPDPGDENPDYPVDSPANDTFSVNGTAFFLIRVWDSVGGTPTGEAAINETLHDALVVGMNVYKRDNIDPIARLYDLNPYTEAAVTEGNKNTTISDAANPKGIGYNIVRGGLYNDGTTREPVKSGFINPRGGSKALAPVNGIYDKDGKLLNGGTLPDYPLKVPSDTVRTGTDPDQVSGKIILRGIAWDDQLIDEIRVRIGTGAPTAADTILKLDQTPGSATRGKMVASGAGIRGGQAVAFAAETLHWKTGHTVEWAYVWDTTLTHSGPATGVQVQVVVKDVKGSGDKPPTAPPPNPPGLTSGAVTLAQEDASPNTAKLYHTTIPVNIVPYITGFERQKPKFTTKRSLQGWYSFYQGEANIKVLGYNFGTGTPNSITLNGTPVTMGAVNSATERTFSIPADGKSGAILMTASGTAVYNNTVVITDATAAANSKSWNREYSSFTPGSDLWVNRPYAHIWRTAESDSAPRTYIGTTGTGAAATSFGLEHPGMALEYTGNNAGRLHGTWAVYGNAVPYYGRNDNYANALVSSANATEPSLTPDISIYNGGSETAANIGYSYQGDGDAQLRVKSVVTNQTNGATMQGATANNPTQRWKNVRISKAADNNANGETNVGRIYMTANDAPSKGLWYGMKNNNANSNTVFIDGGNATNGVGGLGAAGSAGEFSAVDYDTTGPIIAYYDQTNDTVRIALGNNNPTQANSFTRNYLLPRTGSGSELHRGSGRYISIKVDKDNHIHIAFYNSVYNSVVYYYAAGRGNISQNGTAPNGTTVKCHIIDSVVTGGIWTDVSVDNSGNPWIVYGDSSRTGNYDGVRMAYQSSYFARDLSCPVTGADIKGWEALTMPANYVVNNDRLNIEAWPPTVRGGTLGTFSTSIGGAAPWSAAIGYPGANPGSTDPTKTSYMYRVGYFYAP